MKYTSIFLILLITTVAQSSTTKLDKSQIQYSKPESSRGKIVGDKMQYELWYDTNKWRVFNKKSDVFKRITNGVNNVSDHDYSYVILRKSKDVVVTISETRIPVVYEQHYDGQERKLQMPGKTLISADTRYVNGSDVLFIKWGDEEIISLAYILANRTGTVRVDVGVAKNKFSKYEIDMIDLLNGLFDQAELSDEDFK